MANSRFALHARFPEGASDAQVAAAYDAGAAAVGMTLHGVERKMHGVTRHYGEHGGPTVPFSYTLAPPSQLVMMGPYVDRPGPHGREDPIPYAHERLAGIFTHACAVLDAHLGRSDCGSDCGWVQDTELDGPLEFIDWYQYLGPGLVERLDRARVKSAPAFKITETERGAIIMQLAVGPWEPFSRIDVASHLGVTLRPLLGRNPATGEPIVIPWK